MVGTGLGTAVTGDADIGAGEAGFGIDGLGTADAIGLAEVPTSTPFSGFFVNITVSSLLTDYWPHTMFAIALILSRQELSNFSNPQQSNHPKQERYQDDVYIRNLYDPYFLFSHPKL
ncbi:MAG: hypothetical protein GY927_14820 [bacterium]|nr:hypothetical protein [bacterium]